MDFCATGYFAENKGGKQVKDRRKKDKRTKFKEEENILQITVIRFVIPSCS